MASITPVALQPGLTLTSSASLVYASPVNTNTLVKRATFTNTDTSTRTITVYRVTSGGTPSTANAIIFAYKLAPGQDYSPVCLSNLILGAGENLQALSDVAAKVNCFASGFTL